MTQTFPTTMPVGARLARIADALVVAIAVSLPWSTSATTFLIMLWLLALLPTLDAAAVRRELLSPAGGLPVVADAGCCGPATPAVGGGLHDRLADLLRRYDVNDYAASVRVFAVKPG